MDMSATRQAETAASCNWGYLRKQGYERSWCTVSSGKSLPYLSYTLFTSFPQGEGCDAPALRLLLMKQLIKKGLTLHLLHPAPCWGSDPGPPPSRQEPLFTQGVTQLTFNAKDKLKNLEIYILKALVSSCENYTHHQNTHFQQLWEAILREQSCHCHKHLWETSN